jgi:glycosyltransferase involved in cell wall biosynthesis
LKILLSHLTGNSNVRNALLGLYKNNLLHSFHTSISIPKNFISNYLTKFKIFNEFKRREYDISLYKDTYQYPLKEIVRLLCSKFKLNFLIRHEIGIFSVDKIYHNLDNKVSKFLKYNNNNITSVYAYEDGALKTFQSAKRLGLKCIYDLPIGYWKTARKLLIDESIKRPEWSNTLTGFKDSNEKLVRKDLELALADFIIVASSFTAKTLVDYPKKLNNIIVIPYGFPPIKYNRKYTSTINRPIKLLFVGGLSQRKGIANVIEAVEFFGNKVELTIVGQTIVNNCIPLNNALLKHKWIPSLPHHKILDLMANNDILLFPSLFEGFGLVITEAMSQGTPVITTNRTAGVDLIQDGDNGWLVTPGSSESLIKCLQNILSQPEIIPIVGQNAMNTASKRPWSKYSDELTKFIKDNV